MKVLAKSAESSHSIRAQDPFLHHPTQYGATSNFGSQKKNSFKITFPLNHLCIIYGWSKTILRKPAPLPSRALPQTAPTGGGWRSNYIRVKCWNERLADTSCWSRAAFDCLKYPQGGVDRVEWIQNPKRNVSHTWRFSNENILEHVLWNVKFTKRTIFAH